MIQLHQSIRESQPQTKRGRLGEKPVACLFRWNLCSRLLHYHRSMLPQEIGRGEADWPPTHCIWKNAPSQISEKSLLVPGSRRLHQCTRPAFWPRGSTAPSSASSPSRSGASRTRPQWTGQPRHCSERTQCVHSRAARAGDRPPGAASVPGLGWRKHSTDT